MANEIMIYGDIGMDWWSGDGITESHVIDGLNALDPKADCHKVRINSPGGRVDTGLAILSLLRSHKESMKASNPGFKLETVVDGYAMSSASIIMMAGDVRTVALGGIVMIHDAWSGTYGNAEQMRKDADRLDKLSVNAANIYAALAAPAEVGQPTRDSAYFRTLMVAETYFIGDESVKCGLTTQQDSGIKANLLADLSPENLKGQYVPRMTQHYQKRTFQRATAHQSVTDLKVAQIRLRQLLLT